MFLPLIVVINSNNTKSKISLSSSSSSPLLSFHHFITIINMLTLSCAFCHHMSVGALALLFIHHHHHHYHHNHHHNHHHHHHHYHDHHHQDHHDDPEGGSQKCRRVLGCLMSLPAWKRSRMCYQQPLLSVTSVASVASVTSVTSVTSLYCARSAFYFTSPSSNDRWGSFRTENRKKVGGIASVK